MLNRLHALFHRPERGWDPVPEHHAQWYTNMEWQKGADKTLLDDLDKWIGGFAGKEVIDLGAGPGHYAVAFAKRGASVTWYDVSRNYMCLAQQRAKEAGVGITFVLGYLDEAPRLLSKQFDLVFNRGCFNYGWSDKSFASVVYELVRPGGYVYIDTNNSRYGWERISTRVKLRVWLNAVFGVKIGHPYPPRGRVAALFLKYPIKQLVVEYREPYFDRILVQKAR